MQPSTALVTGQPVCLGAPVHPSSAEGSCKCSGKTFSCSLCPVWSLCIFWGKICLEICWERFPEREGAQGGEGALQRDPELLSCSTGQSQVLPALRCPLGSDCLAFQGRFATAGVGDSFTRIVLLDLSVGTGSEESSPLCLIVHILSAFVCSHFHVSRASFGFKLPFFLGSTTSGFWPRMQSPGSSVLPCLPWQELPRLSWWGWRGLGAIPTHFSVSFAPQVTKTPEIPGKDHRRAKRMEKEKGMTKAPASPRNQPPLWDSGLVPVVVHPGGRPLSSFQFVFYRPEWPNSLAPFCTTHKPFCGFRFREGARHGRPRSDLQSCSPTRWRTCYRPKP